LLHSLVEGFPIGYYTLRQVSEESSSPPLVRPLSVIDEPHHDSCVSPLKAKMRLHRAQERLDLSTRPD